MDSDWFERRVPPEAARVAGAVVMGVRRACRLPTWKNSFAVRCESLAGCLRIACGCS